MVRRDAVRVVVRDLEGKVLLFRTRDVTAAEFSGCPRSLRPDLMFRSVAVADTAPFLRAPQNRLERGALRFRFYAGASVSVSEPTPSLILRRRA